MGDHVCTSFNMASTTYTVDVEGKCWVLHVFDVEGEDEEIGLFLSLGSREEYARFPDEFQRCVVAVGPGRGLASLCPGCRPEDMDEWAPAFTEWIREAYGSMSSPPTVHDVEDVPTVVMLSLESICRNSPGEPPPDSSSLH